MRTTYEYQIVICNHCEGRGYQTRHEITNYHKGEYDVISEECPHCNGKGRLRKEVTIVYKPLD
jgi:DnaJ-class molecular chaperone